MHIGKKGMDMKKTVNDRLVLSRETVRLITTDALTYVIGGAQPEEKTKARPATPTRTLTNCR